MTLSNKHRKTLQAVYAVQANVKFKDIEHLIEALGGQIVEREGSRVHFRLNDVPATFHRPHPNPQAGRGAVRAIKDFLTTAGIKE